jgi:hypothetical protein
VEHNIDHDRFVSKNRSMAQAYETGKSDADLERKGFSHIQRQQEASCLNCKTKNKCVEFRKKTSGGSAGVVSFGGGEKFLCSRYVPAPPENRGISQSDIKKLMKNARKGYL